MHKPELIGFPTAKLRGHILLVEDNAINQEVASEQLRLLGITFAVAKNGLEAVAWAEREHFDAILMDIQMPIMDGYEATRNIRLTQPKIPIIALTAAAMIEDRRKALRVGMSAHLGKPIHFGELYSLLSQWLPPSESSENTAPVVVQRDCCVPHSNDSMEAIPVHKILSQTDEDVDLRLISEDQHRKNVVDESSREEENASHTLQKIYEQAIQGMWIATEAWEPVAEMLPDWLRQRHWGAVECALRNFRYQDAATLIEKLLGELSTFGDSGH